MVAEALGSEDRAAASGPVQGLQVLAGDPAVVADVHDLGAHLAHREKVAPIRLRHRNIAALEPRSIRQHRFRPHHSIGSDQALLAPSIATAASGDPRRDAASSAAKAARVSALASSCDIRSRRW